MTPLLALRSHLAALTSLGENGTPIYADEFANLNTRVLQLAEDLFATSGETPEQEAEICHLLLASFNATVYDYGDKQSRIDKVLDRIFTVLNNLNNSPLKCELLLDVYGETEEKELLEEAKVVIKSWGGGELKEEERGVMERWNGMME